MMWAAGLLDGEGCFLISGSPRVCVDSTSKSTIEELYRILGGTCVAVKRRTNNNRPVFRWRVHGAAAIQLCRDMQSLLREKRDQSVLLACIYKYPPRSAMRESLTRRLKALKRMV